MPSASYPSAITVASIVPGDSEYDGTQSQEIQNSRLAVSSPCDFCPHSLPLAVWPTPPGAASPPPAEAIAGTDANPPRSPNHRRTVRIRLPPTAQSELFLLLAPASCLPH